MAFIFDTMGITGTESAPPATRVATVMPMPLFAEKIVYSTSAYSAGLLSCGGTLCVRTFVLKISLSDIRTKKAGSLNLT